MSTMKVTNLKHESSSVNNIVLNSDGSVGGELATTLASKLDVAGGKVVQIVRATDTSSRSTTSTSFGDVTGMAVTITPTASNSAIILLAKGYVQAASATDGANYAIFQITDNSNNIIAGGNNYSFGIDSFTGTGTRAFAVTGIMMAYATPATTSATTYKLRFRSPNVNTTVYLFGNISASEFYAIEVSA